MSTLTIPKTYDTGLVLTEADLDNFINGAVTFYNVTKLTNENFKDSGITASAKLKPASLTTAKINDSAVTTAKINDSAVTTAKINDSAITLTKILDSAITGVKKETMSIESDTISNTSTTSTSYVDTGLSVSITSTGRPLLINLCNNYFRAPSDGSTTDVRFKVGLKRDSTLISEVECGYNVTGVMIPNEVRFPGNLFCIDNPGAGTFTYTIWIARTSSTSISISVDTDAILQVLEVF